MPLTLAEIYALLPDNTANDIDPAEHRATMEAVYKGDVFVTHAEPPSAGWSWVNQGTAAVATLDTGGVLLSGAAVGSNNLIVRVQGVTAPVIVTALIDMMTISDHGGFGLAARESSTGKLAVAYMKKGGSITVEYWTNPTSFSSNPASAQVVASQKMWWQLEDNSTNLIWRVSASGAPGSFIQIASLGRTAHMAGGPDEFGWILRDHNSPFASVLYHWLEA